MAKIRTEDLGELPAEVLPERSVLGPLAGGGGGGGGLLGGLPIVGGLAGNLPLLGGLAGG